MDVSINFVTLRYLNCSSTVARSLLSLLAGRQICVRKAVLTLGVLGKKFFSEKIVALADKTLMFFNALDDPCENYRCLNGGMCLVEDGPYCRCQERFIGRYCDTYKAGKEINYRV